MEHNSSGAAHGTPAPYGRACTNCARAKCRCIYRSGGSDCERCHRLRKECVPSVSVRRRNGKRTHVSRAAQLEAKLEDLVTLLRHQTAPSDKAPSPGDTAGHVSTSTPALSTHSNASRTEDNSPSSTALPVLPPQLPDCGPDKARFGPVSRGSLLGCVFDLPAPPEPLPPPPPPADPPAPAPLSMPSCPYQPTPQEAAEDLMSFRKYMLIFLPFVHLPAAMTSERLKAEYPFLWFNIMTVTCKNVDRRLAMGEAVRQFLAQKMILENEKNLDLLLGLMIIMAWTHYHIKREKPVLSLLASLAKSLVFDLGLNKIPSESYIAACLRTSVHPPPKEKTLEDCRAVLACFVLTSQISHSIKRLDALSWTPHMDACLRTLSQQREWDGDDLLVAQVKVQLVFEELTRATSQPPDGVPPSYVLSGLRTQLRSIQAQLPPHLQQNDTILSHISYTELALREPDMTKPRAISEGVESEMRRYEAMQACLDSVKDWFDRHFSIPSYVYVGMTFSYWWNMGHCLLTLYRLSTVDDPAWDRRAARDKVDIMAIFDRLILGFEQAAAQRRLETGPTADEDIFSKFVKMVQTVRNNWAPELAAAAAQAQDAAASAPPPAEPFVAGAADELNGPFYQQEDSEAWIASLFDLNWEV